MEKEECKLFPPNPLICMVSIDCDKYAYMLTRKEWTGVASHLADAVERLVKAGIDFLAIASNTGHISVPEVKKRFPTLPVLHIADCTAAEIKKMGLTHIGLLGTEPTMRENYLKDQLALHGISTVVPERDEDLTQIFEFIMHELGHQIFKESTRAFFQAQIAALISRGAQGIVLGCTEIGMLVQQEDTQVQLVDTTMIHAQKAVEHAVK